MASKDYLRLCQEAQRKKLNLAKRQEKQIKQIYNDMYKNLSKKLNKVNPDSLTKRYLDELQRELAKEIKIIHTKVEKVIKKNTEKSTNLANNVQLDFFMQINEQYNLNMKDTFSSMFSKIPKAAMDEILHGTAYKDRKGLSKRIWKYTKKFDKDIDYIVTEGIANKKTAYEIAKDLEIYVNPKARKPWEWSNVYPNASEKVDYNAQRLARTAVNHAFQQAQKRSCEKNPYVEGIRWLSASTHRTCELCNSRNGVLYSVKDVPLDHPNGLCTTIPEIPMSFDEIGIELRNWIDGESNSKLDNWFKEYSDEFSEVKKEKNSTSNVFKDIEYDIINNINTNDMLQKSNLQSRLDYTTDKDENFIPLHTIITNVKTIAGNGSNTELRSSQFLSESFGGNENDWSKKVGKIESEKYIFDIHWNELHGRQYLTKIKNRKEKK